MTDRFGLPAQEAAHGRVQLAGNGCFLDAKREEPGFDRRAALEKVEGRQWVGTAISRGGEAVAQTVLRLVEVYDRSTSDSRR